MVALLGLTRYNTGYNLSPAVHHPLSIGILMILIGISMCLASVSTIISLAKKNTIAGIISLSLFVLVSIMLTVQAIMCGIDYTVLKVDKIEEYDLQVIEEQFNCCGWKSIRQNCISDIGLLMKQNCFETVGKNVISMFGIDTFISVLFLVFTFFLIFVSYQSLKTKPQKAHVN
ncbi:hypothetical protein EDI_252640 [Entamoeba dispar SAW760]|uniref:Uncharacterized protein n=1 Tax=Entamoeba dispar (strain ATCC PRA-260 / SAW760) TaxID=370354 RepID=B0EF69_ENTDS|nr:uncharacterized protein EDI_252640 [Entamoeba dispar SAW760]EDR26799.1 hypothetical protein EDI_252640 [Entamoeba dispar SAW760]|eukprot:EDR26799.1 hypothetical protein EDI_252640 [Entamoeba dispar SAW760]